VKRAQLGAVPERRSPCTTLNSVPLNQLDAQFASDDARRAHAGFKGGTGIIGIEQAVELGAAGLRQLGHTRLGKVLLLHLLGKSAWRSPP
jgi:hypothetical protein